MRTRPGFRYSWNPASASPVFWMCGLVMTRSRPSLPASSSSGSPKASGRLASSSRTVTPAWGATRSLCFDLDQRELAVAAVQHADRGALDVAEDHQPVAVDVDCARRIGHRHLPDRLTGGAQDPRHPDALARRPGRPGDGGLARLAEQRGALQPAALAIGELALHSLRLLRELVNRLADRALPAFGVADPVEEFLPAGVQRDVGADAVLLARQHRLRGDGAMVQHPLKFGQLRGQEATEGGSDVDVAASQFESHTLNSQTWRSTLSLQPACR